MKYPQLHIQALSDSAQRELPFPTLDYLLQVRRSMFPQVQLSEEARALLVQKLRVSNSFWDCKIEATDIDKLDCQISDSLKLYLSTLHQLGDTGFLNIGSKHSSLLGSSDRAYPVSNNNFNMQKKKFQKSVQAIERSIAPLREEVKKEVKKEV